MIWARWVCGLVNASHWVHTIWWHLYSVSIWSWLALPEKIDAGNMSGRDNTNSWIQAVFFFPISKDFPQHTWGNYAGHRLDCSVFWQAYLVTTADLTPPFIFHYYKCICNWNQVPVMFVCFFGFFCLCMCVCVCVCVFFFKHLYNKRRTVCLCVCVYVSL